MNWFDFFNFFSSVHNEKRPEDAQPCLSDVYKNSTRAKRRQADVPLYAISFLFSFLRRGRQMRRNFSTTCTISGTRGEKLQADAALCGRGERPKNGADALPCLSDVYKNSTRAKRRQADVPLYGRSMVEMLGVLAIIGVLSVGAMSGYAKAMLKYKLNKQSEQINYLFSSILSYGSEFGYVSSTTGGYAEQSLIPIFKKLNIIPKDMYIEDDDTAVTDALNNRISISSAHEPQFSYQYYIMVVQLNSSFYTIESCRNFSLLAKNYAGEISQFIGGYNGDGRYRFWGNNYCTASNNCIKDITLQDIYDMCQDCPEEKGVCNFAIQWGVNRQ